MTIDISNPGASAGSLQSALASALFGREVLSADRTYYVRTDGSDSNDGLTNSSGGAFLTIQAAIDAAYAINFNGYTVTISIGAGTYTAGFTANGKPVGLINYTNLVIKGGTGTATDVVISITSASAALFKLGAKATIQDLKIQTTTAGHGIYANGGSEIHFSNINFGAVAYYAIYVSQSGSKVVADGNYAISGAQARHLSADQKGFIEISSRTVTITGTPAIAAFAFAAEVAMVRAASVTFSGAATGVRYSVSENAVVQTSGGGASYFPGDVAGSITTGGVYV